MFAPTMHWKHYDPFLRQKDEAFKSSKTGVLELAERFQEFAEVSAKHTQFNTPDESEEKLLFVRHHSESC
jgi:Damage-control phosphatase ARMT1-like domain